MCAVYRLASLIQSMLPLLSLKVILVSHDMYIICANLSPCADLLSWCVLFCVVAFYVASIAARESHLVMLLVSTNTVRTMRMDVGCYPAAAPAGLLHVQYEQ